MLTHQKEALKSDTPVVVCYNTESTKKFLTIAEAVRSRKRLLYVRAIDIEDNIDICKSNYLDGSYRTSSSELQTLNSLSLPICETQIINGKQKANCNCKYQKNAITEDNNDEDFLIFKQQCVPNRSSAYLVGFSLALFILLSASRIIRKKFL